MVDEETGEKSEFTSKMKKNPWMISTFILIALVVILLFFSFTGGITGNVISEKAIGQEALNFFNTQLAKVPGTLASVDEVSGVYQIMISVQGQSVPLYFTRDGNWIQQGSNLIPITGNAVDTTNQNTQTQQTTEVPKSDKPVVELFVMSYCPYGTQAEKGILPVVALLGNKIDFKVRAVHYTLHGDKEDLENSRQLCIREEQGQGKLNKYLVCILNSTDPNAPADVNKCEKTAGVDSAKLKTCLDTKAADYYAADSALSQGYGVQGSPTLIINGVESNAGRSPASYLQGICAAFTSAPEECSENLSSSPPSAGFGYNAGTDTVAKC